MLGDECYKEAMSVLDSIHQQAAKCVDTHIRLLDCKSKAYMHLGDKQMANHCQKYDIYCLTVYLIWYKLYNVICFNREMESLIKQWKFM